MHQNFLQILWLVCQFPIILLKKLIRVMEINHFGWSIETFHHILQDPEPAAPGSASSAALGGGTGPGTTSQIFSPPARVHFSRVRDAVRQILKGGRAPRPSWKTSQDRKATG